MNADNIATPTAFPGILKWQNRIWICLSEFNKARANDSIPKPEDNENTADVELQLLHLKSHYLEKARYHYTNGSFSNAIKACQLLTDAIRVS